MLAMALIPVGIVERGVLTAFPGDPVAGATAAARSSGQARRLVPCLAGGQP